MKIEWRNERRKVKDLIPWTGNPRKITKEQLGHLKASIERFGYAAPVVVNADYTIIAGHMRTRAMMELGMGETEVDVRIASRQLTETELQELALRDNANHGEWDVEKMLEMDLEILKKIGMSDQILNKIARKTTIERAEETPDPPPSNPKQSVARFTVSEGIGLCAAAPRILMIWQSSWQAILPRS